MARGDAVARVLAALNRVDARPRARGEHWEFFCPAHEDGANPAGELTQGRTGALVHCHAGCEQERLLAALSVESADLFDEEPKRRLDWDNPDERYRYTDAEGKVLYEVRRIGYGKTKEIRPFRPIGKKWDMGLPVERVLYRLPEVINAAQEGRTVLVCEGERDVDLLAKRGVTATCNVGGAGKWQRSYSEALVGAEVVIVADRDSAGYRHAAQVRDDLVKAGVEVRGIYESVAGNDVSDHLAAGHQVEELTLVPPAMTAIAKVVTLAMVTPAEVEWLWQWRWPIGKLVVLDGDPGLGKSLLTLDMSARCSNGRQAPDGGELLGGDTVLLSAEDDLDDTIVPRVLAAGGVLNHIHAFVATGAGEDERPPDLPTDVKVLEEIVNGYRARLVVVDPFMAYLTAATDSHKDQDIRRVLRQLREVAVRQRCCMVLVRHLNKSGGGHALYRGGGSIGIVGAARAGFIVAPAPGDESRRIMAPQKNNLAAPENTGSLAFRVVTEPNWNAPRVLWEGAVDVTADQLMTPAREPGVQEIAEEWLIEKLARGPMAAGEVEAAAEDEGISKITLKRAKKALGVRSKRESLSQTGQGAWFWELEG